MLLIFNPLKCKWEIVETKIRDKYTDTGRPFCLSGISGGI
jgi:hypothetical protein